MENKEITVVERVEELVKASGRPIEFEVQELNKLAEKAKGINSISHADFKPVKSEMVKRRNYIKQYCLDARRDIKKVAEGVSDVEKMLYDIFVPEENRLADLAEAEKQRIERIERTQKLPWRKEQLAAQDAEATDDELLELDDKQFAALLAEKEAIKLEKELEAKRAIEAEEQRKKDIAEAEERAKKEAEEKAKREAEEAEKRHKEELEKVEREAKQKEEVALAAEKAEAEEAAKLAKKADYIAWLAKNGYNENTKESFIAKDMGDEVNLYKLVGTYNKTK